MLQDPQTADDMKPIIRTCNFIITGVVTHIENLMLFSIMVKFKLVKYVLLFIVPILIRHLMLSTFELKHFMHPCRQLCITIVKSY